MSLKASFIYKNPDSTRDLNARLRRVINRGIVWGGTMTPGVGLTVQVTPLVAVGFDGMTVEEDAVQTLVVAGAGVKQYVVIHSRYNEGGVPATPTLQWRVLTAAAYAADPEKDYMIVVGTVTPAGVAVVPGELDFTERDEVNPLGRDWYRGVAANPAALPPAPSPVDPITNRVGDFYFVISDQTFHFWTGTMWEPLNTGSYNSETFAMSSFSVSAEQTRFVEGSGVIAGIRPNPQGDFASDTEVNIIETPAVADQIGIDAFTAYVNGHRVQTHGQYVTLTAKPGMGYRYDIVYLEVWREAVAVPESFVYDRNPNGAATYTLQQVDDKVEQLGWLAGIPAAPAADNFNLNQVEPYNHTWRVVKWRIASAANMPSTACLYNPADPAISGLCQNVDSNPFSSQPAGTGTDDRLWVAPSATGVDGFSWAIPLFVIRRTSTEVVPNAIQIFRNGVRHVFPVYPIADVTHAARKALDTAYRSEPTPLTLDHYPYDEPSGFLSGMDFQLETKVLANTVSVYEDQAHVRIRGLEDWIQLASGPAVFLAGPIPAGINMWFRNLIYLKMNVTLYDNGAGTATERQFISQKHRPYLPSSLVGDVRGQGWKRGYVTFEYVSVDLGALDVLDEYDAMTAAGWTRGDLTMAPKNAQYEDGGIWSRAITIDADDRVHPYKTEWAIPICLLHRRNAAVWNATTNPNGAGLGRVDGRVDPQWIYPDDLVDLRHEVGVDIQELERRLEADFDKNMKGQLRTRLANKYRGAGVAGIVAGRRILQSDSIGGIAGTFQLTSADSVRGIWSDAKEFFPVSLSFDLKASSSGPLYNYVYNGGLNEGTLEIRAPGFVAGAPATADASIVRHLPAAVYVDANGANPSYMDYLGPPCWTTQLVPIPVSGGAPVECQAKYIDNAGPTEWPITFKYYTDKTKVVAGYVGQSFAVTEENVLGKAVEMTAIVDTAGLPASATAVLSYWVHYDRSFIGSEYSLNYGLAEVPDEVHAVIKDPGGAAEQINVGPIYTVVRKAVVASNTITITAADVTAASGIPGVVTLCWVDPLSVRFTPAGSYSAALTSMAMNNARDTIVLTYAAPITTTVDFVVFFYTSERSSWVEIGRGGKSIQALLSWTESGEVDLGVPAPAGNYAWNLGASTWRSPSVSGFQTYAPFIWSRPAPGVGDWSAVLLLPTAAPGYENSNLVSILVNGLSQYMLLIVPALTPLSNAAADSLLIHYTYTPYQGQSASGGNQAVVGTAVPKLKQLLHGRVEQGTDFYVTQSGACSYYSGVDSWSGYTPNFSMYPSVGGMGRGHFEEYVTTALVATPTSGGTQDLVPQSVYKRALNAGAVYRLPFPINPNMFSGSTSYHLGCMDFDLDPGRVGASAGYRSYAPSYEPHKGTVKYHQFVNSLAHLATRSESFNSEQSPIVPASNYQPTDNNQAVYVNDGRWEYPSGDLADLDFDVRCRGYDLVKRIKTYTELTNFMDNTAVDYTRCLLVNSNGVSLSGGLSSKLVFDLNNGNWWSSWIDIRSAGSLSPTYFMVYPGTIMEYYLSMVSPNEDRLNPLVQLRARTSPLIAQNKIHHTSVVIEGEDVFYREDRFHIGKSVDLIRLPFGSYSKMRNTAWNPGTLFQETHTANGRTTLVGLDVQYPSSWSPATVVAADALFNASVDGLGHGRGLYIGSTGYRYNLPVFVPGSGTSLNEVLGDLALQLDPNTENPDTIPYMPAEPMFTSSNSRYYDRDHGGPMAYCGFGAAIRSNSNEYKNQVVMQISGGPTGGTAGNFLGYTPNDLHGTAIDAFWPTGRPILKSRK